MPRISRRVERAREQVELGEARQATTAERESPELPEQAVGYQPMPKPNLSTRFKVKLWLEDGQWKLDVQGHAFPNLTLFAKHMSESYRHMLRNRDFENGWPIGITKLIRDYGVPPQAVANSLASAIMENNYRLATEQIRNSADTMAATPTVVTNLDSDTLTEDLLQQPPMLMIGSTLFKLHAAAYIEGSRGLKMMRAKAMSTAKKSAAAILSQATNEAAIATRNADSHLSRVRQTIDSLIHERNTVVQNWWNELGYPFTLHDGLVWFHVPIFTAVREFTYYNVGRHYTWHAEATSLAIAAHKTFVVIPADPLTGLYQFGRIGVWSELPQLPHMSHSGCCMQLSNMPAHIKTRSNLRSLISRIQEGHRVVNFNSLLTSPSEWPNLIRKQFPADLRAFLRISLGIELVNRVPNPTNEAIAAITTAIITTTEQENTGVFDANVLARDVRAAEVRAAEVRAAEVRAAEVRAAEAAIEAGFTPTDTITAATATEE